MIEPALGGPFETNEAAASPEGTSAQRLTDALQTGHATKVAVALFDIEQVVTGDGRRLFEFGYNLRFSDMIDILGRAGLRLVATETSPSAQSAE